MFVLVDATTMTVLDTIEAHSSFANFIINIQMVESNGRLFVIASLQYQFVYFLEVLNDKLLTVPDNRTGIDVTDGTDHQIQTIVQHPS